MNNTFESKRLGSRYEVIRHKSGLRIALCHMPEFSSAYAGITADFGSMDNEFRLSGDGEFTRIPDGTAHFLEHKLFECEDGDAFARYAKTGANANAFTSFDKTTYLFSCTDNFAESLEILLDFVSRPYFTKESVAKEQGIIGQEIDMYLDDAHFRVYFNLMAALYESCTLKLDIAGSKESIAEITPEVLHRCYETFYSPSNMVLSVAGRYDREAVLSLVDRYIKEKPLIEIEKPVYKEPDRAVTSYTEQKLTVATPLYYIGYKEQYTDPELLATEQVVCEIITEALFGEASETYGRLYEQGIINATFGAEFMAERGYPAFLFEGESKDPQRVRDALTGEITAHKQRGIKEDDFETAKRAIYGRYLRMINNVEAMGSLMCYASLLDVNLYDIIEAAAACTIEQANARLQKAFMPECAAMSVVYTG